MSWSYRIVSHPAEDIDGVMHDIREVHYNDDGSVRAVSGKPFAPIHFENDGEDMRRSLAWQLEEALNAVHAGPIVPMPDSGTAATIEGKRA